MQNSAIPGQLVRNAEGEMIRRVNLADEAKFRLPGMTAEAAQREVFQFINCDPVDGVRWDGSIEAYRGNDRDGTERYFRAIGRMPTTSGIRVSLEAIPNIRAHVAASPAAVMARLQANGEDIITPR